MDIKVAGSLATFTRPSCFPSVSPASHAPGDSASSINALRQRYVAPPPHYSIVIIRDADMGQFAAMRAPVTL